MKFLLIINLITILNCNALELNYLDHLSFNRKKMVDNSILGGLSGALFRDGKLYVVSDDRGDHGNPRIFIFDLKIKDSKIDLSQGKALLLKNERRQNFKTGEVDFEGITRTVYKNFLLSSEGDNEQTPRIPPQMFEFNEKGILIKRHDFPAKFIPEAVGSTTKGIQNNLGFESLTSNSFGKTFTAALEAPLRQDVVLGDNQFLRLIEMRLLDSQLSVTRESIYPIDTMNETNGLVDLIELNSSELITLERSWNPSTKKNTIQLFHVTKNLNNYSNFFSIKNRQIKVLKKSKIYDLENLKQLEKLDNFEAITLGPSLPNGNKTLLLISDNNFSVRQKTIFLLFELKN